MTVSDAHTLVTLEASFKRPQVRVHYHKRNLDILSYLFVVNAPYFEMLDYCKNLCSYLPRRLSHNKVLHLDRLRPYTQVEKTLQAHTL